MKTLQIAIYLILNLGLEILFIILYPVLFAVLKFKEYSHAVLVSRISQPISILIHAASVGEINAIRPLITTLLERDTNVIIMLTCNTISGLKTATGLHPRLRVRIAPLDVLHLRWLQLKRWKPKLICIVETEIWVNLLFMAFLTGKPMIFINSRISQRSLSRYLPFKPLFSLLEKQVKEIMTQTDEDKIRFEKLFRVPIRYIGNIKFSSSLPNYDAEELRDRWHFDRNDLIIVFGSSRPGEEELIYDIYNSLKQQYINLKLILAPRHPKRMNEVMDVFSGTSVSLYSELASAQDIMIIDCLGHLNEAYAICDVAIVGGSFFDFGGHNPLEPAYYQKPIIIGEFHSSCKQSVKALQSRIGILVSEPVSLHRDILRLLQNPDLRRSLGKQAKQVLAENSSALNQYTERIQFWMDSQNA